MKARSRVREGEPPVAPRVLAVGRTSPDGIRTFVCGGALAATLGFTLLSSGGFDALSQSVFIALAGLTLLLTAWSDPEATLLAAREPLAPTLGALGVLSVVSAAWTIGEADVALRSGLAIVAYAAVFIAASALTQRVGPRPIVIVFAVISVAEAVVGLRAVALHATPDAELIAGMWRPGGTFQYPPALAILQVGSIAILSRYLERKSGWSSLAAAGTLLSGATIALADSRLAIVLAALLFAILVLRPHAGRTSRVTAVTAAALAVMGAAAGLVLLDHSPTTTARPPGMAPLAGLFALAAVVALGWRGVRDRLRIIPTKRAASVLCIVALLVAASWTAGELRGTKSRTGAPATPLVSALLHGRGHQWSAALRTWLDRPLLGAGSGAYYEASLSHQGSSPTLYAHDLPLELAAELGLGGLLLGLALYVTAVVTIVGASKSSASVLLVPIVVAGLISNLVDWTWHLSSFTALWVAAAGAMHALAVYGRRAERISRTSAALPESL